MRFLVVDDHPIMRFGVRALIAQAWPDAAVAEAASVADGIAAVEADPPDAVVLDLSLPDASGTEAPARMLRAARAVPILVLSLNADPGFASRLLGMGIAGYLPKGRAVEDLAEALRTLLDGRRYATPDVLALLGDDPAAPLAAAEPHRLLSAQELRVMQLIATGRSAAQIAQALHVSVKSVNSYRARVLAKAGWVSNDELVAYCRRLGLDRPDEPLPT